MLGDAAWTEGKSGNALSFDGVDDYAKFSETAASEIGILNQGTVALWFKYTSALDTQPIMPIFYLGMNDQSSLNHMFIIEIGHSNTNPDNFKLRPEDKKLYVTWMTSNYDPILCYDSAQNLEEDTWYHFALVVGPDGNTGFLNGVEMTGRYYNFGTAADQMLFDTIPTKEQLTVGYGRSHHVVSPNYIYFKGAIDDVRIYDRALLSDEIQELI